MGLKIDHECDWCERREAVDLPRKGPLDLAAVGLPTGWLEKDALPGGNVGPQDGLQLCSDCQKDHAVALSTADEARDNVFRQSMAQAKNRTHGAGGPKKLQSSSFGR